MNRRTRLRIGLGVLFASAVLALTAGYALRPAPTLYVIQPSSRVLDLMPNASGECLWWNKPGADGNMRRTDVYFCNGDRGVREYRGGTTRYQRQTVFFKDSNRVRMQAEFADDGVQVVSGFELRDDGSMKWQAVRDYTGMVQTTTYWWDGSVYSVQKRTAGAQLADTTFFFPGSGKRQARIVAHPDLPFALAVRNWSQSFDYQNNAHLYLGSFDKELPSQYIDKLVTQEAQVWNEQGSLVVSLKVEGKTRVETVYRADGTRWFDRSLLRTEEGDEGGGRSVRFVLNAVNVYSSDGTRLARALRKQYYWSFDSAIDYNADGSRLEHKLTGIGLIAHTDRYDRDGKLVSSRDFKKPTAKIELEPQMNQDLVTADPQDQWLNQERLHFRRTVVE